MIDARAIRRLAAMDIQVWRARIPKPAADDRARSVENSFEVAGASGSEKSLPASRRIRLEAGSGRWLLVVDDADRARHASLIEDIRATLGMDDCRFGIWSNSAESGVAPADWQAHGIRHVLVFSDYDKEPDSGDGKPAFMVAGELQRLANSGQARRALWRQLKLLLED